MDKYLEKFINENCKDIKKDLDENKISEIEKTLEFNAFKLVNITREFKNKVLNFIRLKYSNIKS